MPTTSGVSFWHAYEAAVKKALVGGDVGKDKVIFLRTPNQPFTPVGKTLAEAEINYIIYELADRLLLFDGRGETPSENYVKNLDSYLNSVRDENDPITPSEEKRLEDAKATVATAEDARKKSEDAAKKKWKAREEPGDFEDWWPERYPSVGTSREQAQTAQGQLKQVTFEIYGDLDALQRYRKNIKDAQDTHNPHIPLNMPAKKLGGQDLYLPSYTVEGLRKQLEIWGQDKADERSAFFEVPIDSGLASVSLQMTTRGIKKFTIKAGNWDVPNAKEMFTKRRSDAPDVLNPKLAQTIDFLLAYDIKYEVKFGNSGTVKDEAQYLVEEAKIAGDRGYPVLLGILGRRL